jgi:hypothetical protein
MIIRMYVQSISFISLIKFIVRFLKRVNRNISLVFHSEIKFMIFEYGLYYIIPNKFGKQMFGGTSGNTGLPTIPVE